MKVLQPPKRACAKRPANKPPWTKKVRCSKCKAKLLVEEGDVVHYVRPPHRLRRSTYSYLACECPECGNRITLDHDSGLSPWRPFTRRVPAYVWDQAPIRSSCPPPPPLPPREETT